jgi:PAS domain S-box-containing protein
VIKALLILLLLFVNLFAVSNKKITLQLSWKNQFAFAGYYMAKELGYYDDVGIDISIKEFEYGTDLSTIIERDDIDFAIGRSSLLIDRANGKDVVAMGAILQYSPLMLLVRADSNINSVKDLKNKKVMITSDAKSTAAIVAMLNANNLTLDDINVLNHSFNLDDLINKKTDAMASYVSNEPIRLANQNIQYKIFHPRDFGFNFYSDILYTSSKFIKQNPTLTRDFYEATLKGWEYAFNNIGKTAQVIFDKYNTQNLSLTHLVSEAEALKKLTMNNGKNQLGYLDHDRLEGILDIYKVMGFVKKDIDLDKFIYEHNNHKVVTFKLSHEELYLWVTIVLFLIILIVARYNRKLYKANQIIKQNKDKIEKKANSFFEQSANLLVITDFSGRFIEVNNISYDMFGYKSEELVGKLFSDFVHPDDIESSQKALRDLIKGKSLKYFENRYKHKNGSYITLSWSASSDLETALVYASAQDITDAKYKNQLLLEQSKLASMGEMIGNISHQWRQPLSVISTGATGLMLQKEHNLLTDEKFHKTCTSINDNAQYLSKTIDDFRNFIMDNRKIKKFKLDHAIQSSLNLVEGTIKSNNIHLLLDIEHDIQIMGYENELIQCLINILNNAKDVLVEKAVEDKVVFVSSYEKKQQVIIKIKDNGGGVPKDIQQKIFEPYFTTKHQSQGTGLGLHMSYRLIVEGMAGMISVENIEYEYNSKRYIGAEFLIALPI